MVKTVRVICNMCEGEIRGYDDSQETYKAEVSIVVSKHDSSCMTTIFVCQDYYSNKLKPLIKTNILRFT